MSVLDYRTMSPQRYRSIIEAETLFYRRYDQEKFSHHRRHLFLRSSKQFLTVKIAKFGGKHWQNFSS